jgi:FlaG/FlaF family flagellin (archaellin)
MNRDRKIGAVAVVVVVAAVLVFFFYGMQPTCPQPPPNIGVMEQSLTENQMQGSVRFVTVSSLDQLVNVAKSSQGGVYPGAIIYHGYIERLGYTAYYIGSGTYDYTGTTTVYVYKC